MSILKGHRPRFGDAGRLDKLRQRASIFDQTDTMTAFDQMVTLVVQHVGGYHRTHDHRYLNEIKLVVESLWVLADIIEQRTVGVEDVVEDLVASSRQTTSPRVKQQPRARGHY